jgi:hypothetical protein
VDDAEFATREGEADGEAPGDEDEESDDRG